MINNNFISYLLDKRYDGGTDFIIVIQDKKFYASCCFNMHRYYYENITITSKNIIPAKVLRRDKEYEIFILKENIVQYKDTVNYLNYVLVINRSDMFPKVNNGSFELSLCVEHENELYLCDNIKEVDF